MFCGVATNAQSRYFSGQSEISTPSIALFRFQASREALVNSSRRCTFYIYVHHRSGPHGDNTDVIAMANSPMQNSVLASQWRDTQPLRLSLDRPTERDQSRYN